MRVTARCQLFIEQCRKKLENKAAQQIKRVEVTRIQHKIVELTPSQLISARNCWIRHVQMIYFTDEHNALSEKKDISRKSSIIRLNPTLDESKMIRV